MPQSCLPFGPKRTNVNKETSTQDNNTICIFTGDALLNKAIEENRTNGIGGKKCRIKTRDEPHLCVTECVCRGKLFKLMLYLSHRFFCADCRACG